MPHHVHDERLPRRHIQREDDAPQGVERHEAPDIEQVRIGQNRQDERLDHRQRLRQQQ